MVEMTQELTELVQHIENLLRDECREQGLDFVLRVVDLEQEDEWMYFKVKPDQEPDQKKVQVFDYADVMASVETSLRRDEHVEHVFLMPAIAD